MTQSPTQSGPKSPQAHLRILETTDLHVHIMPYDYFADTPAPGTGLAHRACAALCLIGDVPPVFVSSQPIEGSDFMLITGPDGTVLPRAAYDFIGQFVSLEGDLERRGDVMILRIDPQTMELTAG